MSRRSSGAVRARADTEDDVCAELGRIAAEITRVEAQLTSLYAQRLAALHRGMALRVTQRAMGTCAGGITEVAVAQALSKARRRAARTPP